MPWIILPEAIDDYCVLPQAKNEILSAINERNKVAWGLDSTYSVAEGDVAFSCQGSSSYGALYGPPGDLLAIQKWIESTCGKFLQTQETRGINVDPATYPLRIAGQWRWDGWTFLHLLECAVGAVVEGFTRWLPDGTTAKGFVQPGDVVCIQNYNEIKACLSLLKYTRAPYQRWYGHTRSISQGGGPGSPGDWYPTLEGGGTGYFGSSRDNAIASYASGSTSPDTYGYTPGDWITESYIAGSNFPYQVSGIGRTRSRLEGYGIAAGITGTGYFYAKGAAMTGGSIYDDYDANSAALPAGAWKYIGSAAKASADSFARSPYVGLDPAIRPNPWHPGALPYTAGWGGSSLNEAVIGWGFNYP